MPSISVVMAVYNGEKYLKEAIDSILYQTYRDFEFIIIDDCSTDDTPCILASYGDKRIRIIRNERNLKLPASLNRGLRLAQGKYIARMDADDVAMPERFAKQIGYMEAHNEVAVLGGSIEVMDEFGKSLYVNQVKCGDKIGSYYLLPSPIAHPTAMLRKSMTVDEGFFYDEKYTSAQDYDLWLRIAKVHKIANIPDVVLMYRIHGGSISESKREQQQSNALKIFLKNVSCDLSEDEAKAILRQRYGVNPLNHAIAFYKVFRHMDYFFFRVSLGYVYRYIQSRIFHTEKS